ncbi:MAG: hypothetical protein AAGD07_11740 [Planctomycetota bacterium]
MADPTEALQFFAQPLVIAILAFLFVAFVLISGASMKVSLSLVTERRIGILYGSLVSFVAGLTAGVFNAILVVMFGPQAWYIMLLYSLVWSGLVVALMVRCSPFAATLASLIHNVFSTIGNLAVAAISLFVLFMGAQNEMIKSPVDFTEGASGLDFKDMLGQANSMADLENLNVSDVGLTSEALSKAGMPKNVGAEEFLAPESLRQLQPSAIKNRDQGGDWRDAFFGGDSSNESPYNKGASSDDAPPATGSVQINPFAQ